MQNTDSIKTDQKTALKEQKVSSESLKQAEIVKDIEGENCIEKVIIDCNTLLNGSKSKREKKIILTMKNLALLTKEENCDKTLTNSEEFRTHKDDAHEEKHSTNNIFMVHHEENIDNDEIEFDSNLWDVLLAGTDEKELTEEEEKEVLKLHRYFAHRSGRKLWENLFQPAGKLKGKKKMILKFLDKCEVCKKHKRSPPRPKVGLPKAKDVNEVVSIDLKILKKTGKKEIGILYLHDEFSKLIKGKVINDKNKDTIIKGIESKWIFGDGAGPGHPSRGFFSDNGGEFLNDDLIDFAAALDITIRMTAAYSPWMNGSCERNHATVDKLVEKIREDEPKIDLQKAVDLACFVKNAEINKTGFSPLQLFCGRSPGFPGLSDCTPSSIELEGSNEYLRILRRLDKTRVAARQIDCNQRMKVALKSKVNSSCENYYLFGDSVFFKLQSSTTWKSGVVLGQDGKVLFIKYGNFIRRVPLDHVVPAEKHHDLSDVEVDEQDIKNSDRLKDDDFSEVDVIVQKDKEIIELKRTNMEKDKKIDMLENHSIIKPVLKIPKLYQKIGFQMVGKENLQHLCGKVVHRQKKPSASKNIIQIQFDDGSVNDVDFSNEVHDWCDANEIPNNMDDPCCLLSYSENIDLMHENFLTRILTKAQVKGRPEAEKAMLDEIKKFESFQAFDRVSDRGQFAIKTRWVFSEDKEQSKGCKMKARLCMRGDREKEKENIRADSPTAHKDSLKLALAISANEKFDIISGDIKSAFLQGKSLSREVFVVPPIEANEKGVLWLLKKGAYGLIDGSRMFYLELKDKLEKLGMKTVSGDSALFTLHRNEKLIGLVCVHVDDLFMAGNKEFKELVNNKLMLQFKFSKIEVKKFKYLGCEIQQMTNGDISLNQNDYTQKLSDVIIPEGRRTDIVDEGGKNTIRKAVGELLWISLMTRPDLSFEVNQLSGNITNATIKDMKDARRLVEKAKANPVTVNFTQVGPQKDLKIRLFTDASFNNQDGKLRSTEGRVLLLENKQTNKTNLFSWKTKKISRICRSVKAAETRSLEDGLDEAVHYARMVTEIYSGKIDLKNPEQISVEAKTDNKGLWDNLNNSRQCDEKLLRNSVALIKEMVEKGEVLSIDWVDTKNMLADTLTKRGGDGSWIKNVLSNNYV